MNEHVNKRTCEQQLLKDSVITIIMKESCYVRLISKSMLRVFTYITSFKPHNHLMRRGLL